jgi:hypothetical protein
MLLVSYGVDRGGGGVKRGKYLSTVPGFFLFVFFQMNVLGFILFY